MILSSLSLIINFRSFLRQGLIGKKNKFRLKPTAEQKVYFAKTFGCARAIWNMMLSDKIAHYKETGKSLATTPAQYKDDNDWYGKDVIKISRWYPSSQLCSDCGHNSGKKSLHVREWTCPACHTHHDRDINASINILNEGLRLA